MPWQQRVCSAISQVSFGEMFSNVAFDLVGIASRNILMQNKCRVDLMVLSVSLNLIGFF